MPPEVARVMAGAAFDRWIRRALGAILWFAAALALLSAIGSLAGCSYRLEGKVVDGFGACRVARPGDPEERAGGIPGAQVEIVRDPRSTAREVCGRATSGPDGRFELEVEGFGAGWMEEEWLVRVRRSGYENVESRIELPSSPSGRVLLIAMPRGRSAPFREPEGIHGIVDEARTWEPSLGGARP